MSWSECCEDSIVEEDGYFYCDYCGKELDEHGTVKEEEEEEEEEELKKGDKDGRY